jgi:hypothetical protein
MKRKFVAAVLVLAMIFSVSTMAVAEEPTEPVLATSDKGEAGIAYIKGTVDVVETDDPDIPGKEDPNNKEWDFRTDRNIDFGEHDILTNMTEQRFASWLDHRYADTDYVGIIIKNGTVSPYQVVVGIEQFEADKEPTLIGFEFELVTKDFDKMDTITNLYNHKMEGPENAAAKSTHTGFKIEDDYKPGLINAGNNGKDPLTAHVFTVPGLGVHAATWGGVLTVPPSSVAATGEAQAIMTWNIMSVPTGNP